MSMAARKAWLTAVIALLCFISLRLLIWYPEDVLRWYRPLTWMQENQAEQRLPLVLPNPPPPRIPQPPTLLPETRPAEIPRTVPSGPPAATAQLPGLGHTRDHLVQNIAHAIEVSQAAQASSPAQRFDLSIVTIVRNEASWLPEWLEYHMLPEIGFAHVYVYDDKSTDALADTLAPYLARGLVTFYPNFTSEATSRGHVTAADVDPNWRGSRQQFPKSYCKAKAKRSRMRLPSSLWWDDETRTCWKYWPFPQQVAMVRHAIKTHGAMSYWMAIIDVRDSLPYVARLAVAHALPSPPPPATRPIPRPPRPALHAATVPHCCLPSPKATACHAAISPFACVCYR